MSCQIVPALLTHDQEELALLQARLAFAPLVQLDIMDGVFVPSLSVPLEAVAKHPFHNPFEVHLMVCHPLKYIPLVKKLGAQAVIFHVESIDDPNEVIDLAHSEGLSVALALNPDTPHSALETFLGRLNGVLFMTVYPGYYGASFEPKVLNKITYFKSRHPQMQVAIDGGAKKDNILKIKKSGVDKICVGSAIAQNSCPQKAYNELLSLVN